ncbi:MAG: M28 family metallopeptidase [Promethearchaeota archaeon]
MIETTKNYNKIEMKDISSFSEEKLKYYVEKFSFPRRIGSVGEKKARRLTFLEFKKLGLTPHKEDFVCSLFYSINFLRIVLLSIIALMLSLEFTLFLDPRMNILTLIIFTLWGGYLARMAQRPHKINWGKNYYSENIFAFVPAKSYGNDGNPLIQKINNNINNNLNTAELADPKISEEKEIYKEEYGNINLEYIKEFEDINDLDSEAFCDYPTENEAQYGNIIISAHTDSKSQSISTSTRVKLFKYSLYLIAILLIMFLIAIILGFFGSKSWNWVSPFFKVVTTSLTIVVVIFTAILFINRSLNKSVGSLDNATGMACVFALADYFKDKPLDRFNLYFCQFGVEEFGQQGARRFVLRRLRHFKRGRTFNINLDMVGCIDDEKVPFMETYGFSKKIVDPLLISYIKKCSEKLGIEIEGFNLPTGAHTDRMAFTKYGLNGIDFVSFRAGYYTHSYEDTPDKVNYKIMQDTLRIINCMLFEMDKDLKNDKFPPPKEAKHLRQGFL